MRDVEEPGRRRARPGALRRCPCTGPASPSRRRGPAAPRAFGARRKEGSLLAEARVRSSCLGGLYTGLGSPERASNESCRTELSSGRPVPAVDPDRLAATASEVTFQQADGRHRDRACPSCAGAAWRSKVRAWRHAAHSAPQRAEGADSAGTGSGGGPRARWSAACGGRSQGSSAVARIAGARKSKRWTRSGSARPRLLPAKRPIQYRARTRAPRQDHHGGRRRRGDPRHARALSRYQLLRLRVVRRADRAGERSRA